jgi:hypothetical protein
MSEEISIPQRVTEIRAESEQIPAEVAEQKEKEEKELSPYFISFYHYNDKLCEIEALKKNNPKKALFDLIKIGQSLDDNDFKKKGIDKLPIANVGDYKKLYNKLPPGAELYENKIQGESRMFYFIVDRICCIVALTASHLETDKVRK